MGTDVRQGAIRDISSEYASAQLYVISSLYESQGLATAEALARGLPAVGFADCPGTNTLIHPGCDGVLVSSDEDRARSLAAASEPLMCDASARLGLVPANESSVTRPIVNLFDTWIEMLGAVVEKSRVARPPQNLSALGGKGFGAMVGGGTPR